MKKKLLSLVMACAMIMSLAVPAFANYFSYESESSDSLTPDGIDFTVKVHVPTVKLSMPVISSEGNPVVLNPYKLTYTTTANADNKLNNVGVTLQADAIKQVISPVFAIKNETDVALKFDVKATTTLDSSAAFAFNSSNISLTEKAKKAYIALVIKKTEDTTGPIATTSEQTLDPFDTANNEVVVLASGDKSTSTSLIRKLAPIDSTHTTNYLLFQFQGDMTREPTIGWTKDDVFTTTLEFTFTPQGNQDYNATVSLATGSATTKAKADLPNAIVIDPATTLGSTHSANASTAAYATCTSAATGQTATKKDGTTAITNVKDLVSTTQAGWSLLSAGASARPLTLPTARLPILPRLARP